MAARSLARPLEPAAIEDHAVVRDLAHRIAEVSEPARARMDRIGELDVASQDVLIEVVRTLEEQQWMVRAQLSARRLTPARTAQLGVRPRNVQVDRSLESARGRALLAARRQLREVLVHERDRDAPLANA